jgi:hypothetical protein
MSPAQMVFPSPRARPSPDGRAALFTLLDNLRGEKLPDKMTIDLGAGVVAGVNADGWSVRPGSHLSRKPQMRSSCKASTALLPGKC